MVGGGGVYKFLVTLLQSQSHCTQVGRTINTLSVCVLPIIAFIIFLFCAVFALSPLDVQVIYSQYTPFRGHLEKLVVRFHHRADTEEEEVEEGMKRERERE